MQNLTGHSPGQPDLSRGVGLDDLEVTLRCNDSVILVILCFSIMFLLPSCMVQHDLAQIEEELEDIFKKNLTTL